MIKFNIPDFFNNNTFLLMLNELLINNPEYFYDNVSIGSVYGTFPGTIWNGGRADTSGLANINYIHLLIDNFNKQNIPIRFTFTNCLLEKHHCYDTYCNTIVEAANNGRNEIIVNSPILEDYLRNKYPNFKYILSATTCQRGIDNINQLTQKYDYVVLDYNDNKNEEILNNIKDKDKIEIMLNEPCVLNCAYRKKHYESMSKEQLNFGVKKDNLFSCPNFTNGNLYKLMNEDNSIISPNDLYNKYTEMGFNNFKIVGRNTSIINIVEACMIYMVKPEYRDEVRFEILSNIIL